MYSYSMNVTWKDVNIFCRKQLEKWIIGMCEDDFLSLRQD
jgi:hypothetical protein